MRKLQFSETKTLKLTNVLTYKVLLNDGIDLNVIIEQMKSYIKARGAISIGPLIQYTKTSMVDSKVNIEIALMLQCNNFIHEVELPYSMDSIIRIPDALYCRYYGPENKLKFAYDKIKLEAFEKDIDLDTSSYTIFVQQNVEEELLLADVFVPRVETHRI